jgi:hypothetical protein
MLKTLCAKTSVDILQLMVHKIVKMFPNILFPTCGKNPKYNHIVLFTSANSVIQSRDLALGTTVVLAHKVFNI